MSETQRSSTSTSVKRWVAAHPVAAMLLLMFVVGWGFLVPAALAGVPFIPGPILATVLLAQIGPAILVSWVATGRPGVRALFRQVFRWRVHPAWYAFALFAIPVVSLLWTAAVFGGGAVHALFTDRKVILAYLNVLTIFPIVSLWEETAWMGMIQSRLQPTRGPVLAAVITAPLFGLLHLPLNYDGQIVPALLLTVVLMLFDIPFRMLLGWIYNATGGSILLVGLAHTTFDAANNTGLLVAAAPGQLILQPGHGAVLATVLALAISGLVLTRGRLGYTESKGIRPALATPIGAQAQ